MVGVAGMMEVFEYPETVQPAEESLAESLPAGAVVPQFLQHGSKIGCLQESRHCRGEGIQEGCQPFRSQPGQGIHVGEERPQIAVAVWGIGIQGAPVPSDPFRHGPPRAERDPVGGTAGRPDGGAPQHGEPAQGHQLGQKIKVLRRLAPVHSALPRIGSGPHRHGGTHRVKGMGVPRQAQARHHAAQVQLVLHDAPGQAGIAFPPPVVLEMNGAGRGMRMAAEVLCHGPQVPRFHPAVSIQAGDDPPGSGLPPIDGQEARHGLVHSQFAGQPHPRVAGREARKIQQVKVHPGCFSAAIGANPLRNPISCLQDRRPVPLRHVLHCPGGGVDDHDHLGRKIRRDAPRRIAIAQILQRMQEARLVVAGNHHHQPQLRVWGFGQQGWVQGVPIQIAG